MNGKQDLSENLKQQIAAPNITVDLSQSYWDIKTIGSVTAEIGFHWTGNSVADASGDKLIVDSMKFCDKACTVTVLEELKVHATKNAVGSDTTSGTIDSQQTHTETYTGTGKVNQTTFEPTWNDDLEVTKDDQRTWAQDLQAPCSDWQYTGNLHSTADIKPYPNNYSLIDDTVKKDLTVNVIKPDASKTTGADPGGGGSGGSGCPNGTKVTNEAHVDKTESSLNQTGLPEVLTRTGTGSHIQNDKDINYSGIFNTDADPAPCQVDGSADMCITASSTGYDYPYKIGTRLDPFTGFSPYTQSYLPNFVVPNYFTVSTRNAGAVMRSPNVPLGPGKIAVFKSWDPKDPKQVEIFGDDFKQMQPIMDQAKQLGMQVTYYDTTSSAKFLAAVKSLASGTWVVNLGYGSPNSIDAGPDDEVFFPELDLALESTGSTIAYIGDTCYAGRVSIAQRVEVAFGSYGINQGNNDTGTLGQNFLLIGTNGITETTGSFLKFLQGAISSCK